MRTIQIHIGNEKKDRRRIDFFGNSIEGVYVELINQQGVTYFSQKITDQERLRLIDTLTRKDNGGAV